MKELLDQLEARLSALLDERDALRRELETLRGEQTRALSPLREEIAVLQAERTALQAALAEEQAVRDAATQRIDALLLRVKERIPE